MLSPLLLARRAARRLARAWEAEVRARARRRPILADTILYESFGGNGALDNPEAIFRRLLDRSDVPRFRHLWVLGPGHSGIRRELRARPGVRVVRYRSSAYWRAVSRARILVNNATFPPEWGKRDGQLYLNTWHGTPLKHMGYHMPDGALQSANTLRNFLSADLLLAQNAWMAERMYREAYRLDGIYRGRILELGYPRTDRQVLDERQRSELLALLGAGSRRLVVYAPTWSGDSFARPRDEAAEQLRVVRELQSALGDGYLVRIKAHQAVHALLGRHPDAAALLIDNDIPTNRILGVTDHLITDFSSIFFDFLAVDRPITFFVPPGNDYRGERGAYFSADELPGPTLGTVAEVADRIRSTVDSHDAQRRAWRGRFAGDVDGLASDRVIERMLASAADPAPPAAPAARRSVLIYLGGMRSNGITSSALNLLRALDHDRWDVTALIARPRGNPRENQALIDPRVRQVFRIGGMNGTKWELLRTLGRQRLAPRADEDAAEARLWRDEWRRLLGSARFDVVVDFSGYSRFWTQLLLHGEAARRVIWLHNDIAAEVHRTGAGRKPVHRSLPGVLQLLPRFDALVSVSPRLSEVNRDSLASAYGVSPERFVAARNLVDAPRVTAGALVSPRALPEFLPLPATAEAPARAAPSWLDDLESTELVWFVTVGRLSPEKNQARLIAAFADVHARHPEARLLLIGDGPLRARLEEDIRMRGLDGVAVIAGRVANPFPLVAAARAFVLSSNYEGQPMVLLEAAALGLPVITTDFASSADALPPENAVVVPQDAGALARAMLDIVDAPRSAPPFDADAYNRESLREVERALDPASVSASPGSGSSSTGSPSTASAASASSATTAQASSPASAPAASAIPTQTTVASAPDATPAAGGVDGTEDPTVIHRQL